MKHHINTKGMYALVTITSVMALLLFVRMYTRGSQPIALPIAEDKYSTSTIYIGKNSYALSLPVVSGFTMSTSSGGRLTQYASGTNKVIHLYISDETLRKYSPTDYLDNKTLVAVPDARHVGSEVIGGMTWYKATGGETDFYVASATGTNALFVLEFKKVFESIAWSLLEKISLKQNETK